MIKKKRRLFRQIGKGFFLTLYTMMLAGLVVSGLAVQRIDHNFKYVGTTYANTVDVDGVRYFYREVGENNSDTILMIHGFLGSSYDFIDVMNALKDRFHVIAVDLIGFGLSEKPIDFDYAKQNQAEGLVKFLDTLGIDEVTIMAHSMGGEVSIHLAHDYPDYVNEMILIGSGGYVEESQNGLMPSNIPMFVYDYVVRNYYIQRTFFLTAYAQDEIDTGRITYHDFDEMYFVNKTIPGNILQAFTRDNDSGSTNEKLAHILQPTLLIWGEFDSFIPLATGIKLQLAMADVAQLVVMNDAGHLPFDTYFDEFMIHVEEFIT
jgi:pimeloyl-ACP methyl ester carboxylesterase